MAWKLSITRSHAHAFLFIIFFNLSSATMFPEADALVMFKASLTNNTVLSNWTDTQNPCNNDLSDWPAVSCSKGSVIGLMLANMGLGGTIDVHALSQLPNLEALSFAGNAFAGPLPKLSELTSVKAIDLSNNMLSGEISKNAFEGMVGLLTLDFENNQFSGPIPTSLADLSHLTELKLENNEFQGEIPPFPEGQLRNFSVANNKLTGEIPLGVSHFSASAFDGNIALCGVPMTLCPNSPPGRVSSGSIAVVTLLIVAAFTAIIVVLIILCRRRRPSRRFTEMDTLAAVDLDRIERGEADTAAPSSPGNTHQREKSETNVSITFLREDRDPFDMTDLLRASAEILGSGLFGSSYKAMITESQIVVVKRYRHMNNVSKQDFQEHMRRLGRVNHPNVLPLVGFYYRREEKLLVYDFVSKSSLAAHLHANRSRGSSLDWATRFNITKGVARGLLCLYNELPSLTAAHGHLKSSNVLLDASNKPSLTDYGLVPIVNQEHAEQHMISYKSPEYKRTGRITKKTDVWSLGVLILEVLTGRFPSNYLKEGKAYADTDTAAWVESVANDERNGEEVFDAGMEREEENEGEMMKLLRIGFACCQVDVEVRPDIKEVVKQIEDVREREGGDGVDS